MTEISEAMTNRIAMAVASAHLVIHPGPRVYWGRQELMIYTGCTKNSLRELTGRPDFPRPVSGTMNSYCRNGYALVWRKSGVIGNFLRYVNAATQPDCA